MTALTRKLECLPEGSINEQQQSPLFRLPPEIREEIWKLAIARYDDPTKPFEVDTFYCRPGYTHHQIIHTAILQTCRAAYLETAHMPLSTNVINFWCYGGIKGAPDPPRTSYYADLDLDEDDTPWHFECFRRNADVPVHHIKAMHWFVQQFWLECDNFMFATSSREASHVEHLILTLRRSDFWDWQSSYPIGIDPRLPARVTAGRMKETWMRDYAGEVVPQHPDAFGSHLRNMPLLKTFVLNMETEEKQEAELEAIVNHAKKYWSFQHFSGDKMVSDQTVKVERWIGPPCLVARRGTFQRVSEKPRLAKYTLVFKVESRV